jgi:hypothetical protein
MVVHGKGAAQAAPNQRQRLAVWWWGLSDVERNRYRKRFMSAVKKNRRFRTSVYRLLAREENKP